jgi:hypothetical protein
MIIIFGLIGLLVIGIVIRRWFEDIAEFIIILSVSSLLISVGTAPVSHYIYRSEIQGFESVRQTIDRARLDGAEIESAAIQLKIAEQNAWLAKVKYWNTTVFGLWVPNEVDALEPMK